jgi:hypothetical protein
MRTEPTHKARPEASSPNSFNEDVLLNVVWTASPVVSWTCLHHARGFVLANSSVPRNRVDHMPTTSCLTAEPHGALTP